MYSRTNALFAFKPLIVNRNQVFHKMAFWAVKGWTCVNIQAPSLLEFGE